MLTCVIPGCNSSSKNCRLSFFEIPVKLNVRQKWIEVINNLKQERGESSWIPRDRDAVCSKHFAIQEFKNDVRKKALKEDVLPSVFCDYPEVLAPVYLKNLDQDCTKKVEVSKENAICRLCGFGEGQLINMFDEEGTERNIPNLIQKYLPIDINKEGAFTKAICYVCVSALLAWNEIYQQTIRVDQELNSFLTSNRLKDDFQITIDEEKDPKDECNFDESSNENELLDDTENNFTPPISVSPNNENAPSSLDFLILEEEKENSIANVIPDLEIVDVSSLNTSNKPPDEANSQSVTNEKTFNYTVAHLYQCNICKDVSRTQLDFKIHIASHKTVKHYTCSICDATFNLKKVMETHIREAHSNKRLRKRHPLNNKSCFHCGREFTVRASLNIHIHKQHWDGEHYVCDVCEVKFLTEAELRSHIQQTNHKTDGCTIKQCINCGLEFESRFRYGKHIATKHGSGLKCSVCGIMMKNFQELQDHEGLHPQLRPHKCHLCGKNFKRLGDFNKHQMVHTGERPYVCEICGKNFSRKHNMHLHRRSHFGEKPFSCAVCNLSFSRMGDLRKHKQTHYLKNSLNKL